jgi:nitrogen fixation/metabolism regulation signal transduction histidine kinase
MLIERTFGGTVEDILKGARNLRDVHPLNAARIIYRSAVEEYNRMLDEVKRNFTFTSYCGEEMIKNSADALRDLWEEHPEEEGIIQVRVSDEGILRIEVEDNGLGLSDGAKRHLFQRKFTTKDHSYIGKQGIGMLLSKREIFDFGGDMGYIEKNRGVIFWSELGLYLGDELNYARFY